MTNPAPVDLDALEALEKVATSWPWAYDEFDKCVVDEHGDVVCDAMDPKDDKVIAALRNAAPALIEAARERDAFRAGLNAIVNMQSTIGRAAIREFASDVLAGRTKPTDDQSPLLIELRAARERIAALTEGVEELAEIGEVANSYDAHRSDDLLVSARLLVFRRARLRAARLLQPQDKTP